MFYLLHFWCSTLHSMKSAQHCLHSSSRCTRYMWSNMFALSNRISAIFVKIENVVYTSFQNSTLLFINELIFDIMDIENNHSLEFEWIPMLAPLRSANDWRFSWLVMFSLSHSKIDWILCSNAEETLQKMLARKCSYHGKHMKDWKWALIKSLKLPNFSFDIRLSMYWQNAFFKIFLKLVW